MNIMQSYRKTSVGIWLLVFGLVVVIGTSQGCKRSYYRQKADSEAYALVRTAANDPRWELNDFTIRSDRDSRFYDPYNPDCEPMPEDDPTAAKLMQCVDGKRGSKEWAKYGKTKYMDNPHWRERLSLDENGVLRLDKESAVRLALKHSPAYQRALEELYLSALEVSTQRYVFDTQFFGGDSLFYSVNGTPRTQLDNDMSFGLKRKFATGANLAVDLANNMTWQFTGQDTFSPHTSFSFSVVQPLLRGAGRAVALESLTQAERNFLAEVRSLAYFQQGFYAATVIGSSGAAGASGTSGGYYSLLSNQVEIENQKQNIASLEDTLNRSIQFFFAGRGSSRRIDLDRTRLNLLNSQSSLIQQKGRFENSVEGYLVDFLGLPPDIPVEVSDPLLEQFELMSPSLRKLQNETKEVLAILRDENRPVPENIAEMLPALAQRLSQEMHIVEMDFVRLEQSVEERIDNLRVLAAQESIRNGEVLPNVSSIEDFERRVQSLRETIPQRKDRVALVTELCDLFQRYEPEEFLRRFEEETLDEKTFEALYRLNLLSLVPVFAMEVQAIEEAQFAGNLKALTERRRKLKKQLDILETNLQNSGRYIDQELYDMQKEITAEIQSVLNQSEAVQSELDEAVMQRIAKWVQGDRSLSFSTEENPKDFASIKADLLEEETKRREGRIPAPGELFPLFRQSSPQRNLVTRIAERLGTEVADLLTDQAKTRLDAIPLNPVDMTAEEAFSIAAENRLDWMNRKANLVDKWRQIELRANDLRGVLDLRVDGSIDTNRRSNMAKFAKKTGQITVGLEWESPLSRLNEQNAYRAALIDYQQARRDYYQYVDSIKVGLRDSVRNIKIDQLNFEVLRMSIFIAIDSVENANLNLESGDATDVNATQNVLDSLEMLLASQNNFMSNWVNYLGRRMQLELDTGTFRLDDQGMWIDSGSAFGANRSGATPEVENPAPVPYPVPLPGRSETPQPPRNRPVFETPELVMH